MSEEYVEDLAEDMLALQAELAATGGPLLDMWLAGSFSSELRIPEDENQYNALRRLMAQYFLQNVHLRRAISDFGHRRNSEIEPMPENPIMFDKNLPIAHSYLGSNMERVSGVNYFQVGHQCEMTLFVHKHILLPGEVLPLVISNTILEPDMNAQQNTVFGVCFPEVSKNGSDVKLYGVTCQIYEKGTNVAGTPNRRFIKSRALQRFVVMRNQIGGPLQSIEAHSVSNCKGIIKILPETFLSDPLKLINMGSMNRFRDNLSMREMYRRQQAAGTAWPPHIYNGYSFSEFIEKARAHLTQHKIETMPLDAAHISFWIARNSHVSDDLMKEIFKTDSVNTRFNLMSNTCNEDALFTCRNCNHRIASCCRLFAMSKHGVQAQYCSSDGFTYELSTCKKLLSEAISFSGVPSSDFSWFPGYEWHTMLCKICLVHIGWKYKSIDSNLLPRTFYAISSAGVGISPSTESSSNNRVYN